MRICWPMEFSTTGGGQTRPIAASPILRDDGLVEQDEEVAQICALALRRRAEADGDIAQMFPGDGALDDRAIMAEAVVAKADLRGERGGAALGRIKSAMRIASDAAGLDVQERAHLIVGRHIKQFVLGQERHEARDRSRGRRDVAPRPALDARPARRKQLPGRIGLPLGLRFHPIMAFIVGGQPQAVAGRSIEQAGPGKRPIE